MTTLSRFLAIASAVVVYSLPTLAQPVKITAPETLAPLVQKWADAYAPAHAGTKIEPSTVATSEAALDALKSRKTDIATVSRRLKRKEAEACATALGQRPAEYKVAVCAVAVYVPTNNTIKALDLDLLESILKGETATWKDAGGKEGSIAIYLPKDSPRTMEYIREEFLAGKELPATFHLLPSADLPQAVAADKNAIGFGDALSPSAVRVLGVKRAQSSPAETPTVQSIAEMDYPVARYIYQIIDTAADKGEAKSWLDWIRSDDGQKAITATGYYAIPAKQRTIAPK